MKAIDRSRRAVALIAFLFACLCPVSEAVSPKGIAKGALSKNKAVLKKKAPLSRQEFESVMKHKRGVEIAKSLSFEKLRAWINLNNGNAYFEIKLRNNSQHSMTRQEGMGHFEIRVFQWRNKVQQRCVTTRNVFKIAANDVFWKTCQFDNKHNPTGKVRIAVFYGEREFLSKTVRVDNTEKMKSRARKIASNLELENLRIERPHKGSKRKVSIDLVNNQPYPFFKNVGLFHVFAHRWVNGRWKITGGRGAFGFNIPANGRKTAEFFLPERDYEKIKVLVHYRNGVVASVVRDMK